MDLYVEIIVGDMTMRRLTVQIGLVVALFAFAPPARAQGYALIVLEHPFRTQNLAGIVVDAMGETVSGVVVEECDAKFTSVHAWNSAGEPLPDEQETDCDREPKHILSSTTTDANGHFTFPHQKSGTTHYLYLHSNGFDPMKITVQLRRFATKNLRIKLVVAT
ncbi:MAG: hypothetical protein ABSC77_02045 [Terracidiphilus sp.]|jgi:hypothetical protein